jgi:pimeloyl-ACP methyl ester carboxylesterase
MTNMTTAFLIPGFSPDKTFSDPGLDELKQVMAVHDILLNGITDGWGEHSVQNFGQLAVEQSKRSKYDGILIGHSLGALAALSVVDQMPVRHLVLCSPSALFSEDIQINLDPVLAKRIGEKRVEELAGFSAAGAVSSLNRLNIPTTILFGSKERELHPNLVARSNRLAAEIVCSELIEVPGAAHFIGSNPYGTDLARIISRIAAVSK